VKVSLKLTFVVMAVIGLAAAIVLLIAHSNMSDHPQVEDPIYRNPVFDGNVVDSGGAPMAGAFVSIPGNSSSTLTGEDGRFSLPFASTAKIITAWKDGYFIANASIAAPPLQLTLRKLPAGDHDSYQWRSPTPELDHVRGAEYRNCGSCHQAIYKEWSISSHAWSVVRRHFLNLYEGTDAKGESGVGWNLVKERPEGIGVCAACHAPTLEPDASGGYDLRAALNKSKDQLRPDSVTSKWTETEPGVSGVHCDYCHKVAGPAEGELGLAHGRYGLSLLRPAQGQLLFGPLKDSTRPDTTYSAFQRDSRMCASCHEGTVFGVHVYSTYSEWRASAAGKRGIHCQECHMKPSGRLANLAPGNGGVERDPTTLSNHQFFDVSAVEMLRRCLEIDLQPVRQQDGVHVRLAIRPRDVGHRVPTGFADRNIIVLLEAVDAEENVVAPLKGPLLEAIAGETVSGKPGRLYAKILKDFEGKSPVPFWRASPEFTDTRLTPGETDVSEWIFPKSVETIRARVIHRRFWPEVAKTKGWVDNENLILNWSRPVRVP
jgi:hypothetical protein